MESEWISAAETVRIVSGITSINAVHRTISSRAHAGLIASRARRILFGAQTQDDCDLPTDFWKPEHISSFVQDWATGDLRSTVKGRECLAYGVEFKHRDVKAMLPNRMPASLKDMGPGNFAAAGRCLEELQGSLDCNSEEASSLILRGCRAGLVPARCAHLQWRVVNRYGQEEYDQTESDVPDWFWEHCIDDPRNTILNFQSGRFAGRGMVDGEEHKAVLTGVEFEVASVVEIEEIELRGRLGQASAEKPTSGPSPVETPAGRRLSARWRPWIAELAAHIHERGIPEGVGSQGQEELITAIAEALALRGHEGLARSTVQPVVQAVLDRLRSAENS